MNQDHRLSTASVSRKPCALKFVAIITRICLVRIKSYAVSKRKVQFDRTRFYTGINTTKILCWG